MTSFGVTDEQKAFFDEFGFLVFRQLFSEREMDLIGVEAQSAFEDIYAGGRKGGTHGRWVPLLRPTAPFSASLLEDDRVYEIATRTFDESVIGLNVDMLEWYADTGWHRDIDVPGNTGLKLLYYLEPLTVETGALHVIPSSHIEPHQTEIPKAEPLCLSADDNGQDYKAAIRGLEIHEGDVMLPSVVVETRPGDAIAFALPLLHAAFGGRNRRLGASMYWYPSATEEQKEARCREAAIIHSNHTKMFNYPKDAPFCHPDWIAAATGNPIRLRWIENMRDLGWIPQ